MSVCAPPRYDFVQSLCVNNEIRSVNSKLMKSVRAYQLASILELSNVKKLFTNHGLHLNGLGMEVLSKQIISLTYTILDQKKDHPITLCWNLDLIHTDTLHQGRVINRTSTRTKNTPSTESNDFLW